MSGARSAGLTLYWPGRSLLHRAPVWSKLLVLALASGIILAIDRIEVSLAAAAIAVTLTLATGVPARVVAGQLRPVVFTIALIAAIQAVLGHWDDGMRAGARLLALGALAVVFTLTTSFPTLVGAVERLLTALRVAPQRVVRLGLTVGLMLRSIEHLGQSAHHVLDARRARGLQRSPRAFAVPMVVAAGRFAHDVGEALEARGLGARWTADTSTDQPRPMPVVSAPTADRASARWHPNREDVAGQAGRPATVPPTLILEALAQCAGRLLHAHPLEGQGPGRWALAGIDDAEWTECAWDEALELSITVGRRTARAVRLSARATSGGRPVCSATLLMVPFVPSAGEGA